MSQALATAMKSRVLEQVPGLAHGFGTIAEPVPRALEPEWAGAHPSWKQVHGTRWIEVAQPAMKCGEGDALVTFRQGLPVAVVTADCVPVLLARKSGGAGAAIHAGWRGTFAGVVDEVSGLLLSRGEKFSDWVAVIGPAIGPCCYEVSSELLADFLKKFEDLPPGIVSPASRKLDLPAIHEARLKRAGFGEVELIRACTRCSLLENRSPVFHSYRREQNKNRQYSGLVCR